MILIEKQATNTVIVTLKEKQTISPAAFVFKFKHDQSGEEKIFAAQDLSLFTDRYNQFQIVEDETEDFYAATVELQLGYHHYWVYQVTPSSPPSITPSDVVLEVGKVLVVDPNKPSDAVYTSNDGINNVVYNGR